MMVLSYNQCSLKVIHYFELMIQYKMVFAKVLTGDGKTHFNNSNHKAWRETSILQEVNTMNLHSYRNRTQPVELTAIGLPM